MDGEEFELTPPGVYLYRTNVRYRSERIRNTAECDGGDKVGMERRLENGGGIGHRTDCPKQVGVIMIEVIIIMHTMRRMIDNRGGGGR